MLTVTPFLSSEIIQIKFFWGGSCRGMRQEECRWGEDNYWLIFHFSVQVVSSLVAYMLNKHQIHSFRWISNYVIKE